MPSNPTSSVSLAAMPTAGQIPATGTRSAVLAANSRLPSGAAAVTSTSVTECAPEQYCLMPSRRQPRPARLAVSPGPGGCAAQTPQRLPAGGARLAELSQDGQRVGVAFSQPRQRKIFPGQVRQPGPALAGPPAARQRQVQPARLNRVRERRGDRRAGPPRGPVGSDVRLASGQVNGSVHGHPPSC